MLFFATLLWKVLTTSLASLLWLVQLETTSVCLIMNRHLRRKFKELVYLFCCALIFVLVFHVWCAQGVVKSHLRCESWWAKSFVAYHFTYPMRTIFGFAVPKPASSPTWKKVAPCPLQRRKTDVSYGRCQLFGDNSRWQSQRCWFPSVAKFSLNAYDQSRTSQASWLIFWIQCSKKSNTNRNRTSAN